MNNECKVKIDGKQLTVAKGLTLSEIVKSEKPCGGHGKCGKCRVIAKGNISKPTAEETQLLLENEIARGIRLACLTIALGDCEIETLSVSEEAQILTEGVLSEFEISPEFSNYGVAIDIGTTTIAARLYTSDGSVLSETTLLNPQLNWGADVISRIEAAIDGKAEELAKAIRNALNDIFDTFATVIDTKKIDGVVITGNTVMLSLLTGQSVKPFSHAPFNAERLFGETLTARELSLSALSPDTKIYLPPCISAFVGADITCALIATRLCECEDSAILADIGTNGEMALWHNGELTVCSTAAGPAFEGVGISMGMRCAAGAIDKVEAENFQLKVHVIDDLEPTGICGSGLVDAVASLIEIGKLDESGYIEEEQITVKSNVVLTKKDIRMVQLAKSAVCAGLLTLIDSADLKPQDLQAFYVAGGFGNYLNKKNAAKIGLFPKELSKTTRTVGNAALSGAAMILLNSNFKRTAESISKNANVLNLSKSPVFSEHYMMRMLFEER